MFNQQVQQEVGLGEDFDTRILAEVEPTVVKAKRLTLTGRFIPLFKAAAVIDNHSFLWGMWHNILSPEMTEVYWQRIPLVNK